MIHLLKLSVGSESVEDHESWQRAHFGGRNPVHVTRMWPKREAEVLDGGSLYWVVKGFVLCRQRIVGLEERRGADGILRCGLVLDPEMIRTEAQPRRAFQGWRYLEPKDAPRDLKAGRMTAEPLPPKLVSALAEIGLR
ncbi:MAG: DUF1489 family protein [Pseudomonadota bacterium]